jgi:hypothetical protein
VKQKELKSRDTVPLRPKLYGVSLCHIEFNLSEGFKFSQKTNLIFTKILERKFRDFRGNFEKVFKIFVKFMFCENGLMHLRSDSNSWYEFCCNPVIYTVC